MQGQTPYRPWLIPLVAAGSVFFSCSSLAAQDIDPEIIRATTGEWLVAPADGKPGCRIRLTDGESIGGLAVEGAEEACASVLPAIGNAAAWNFGENGAIQLIDPVRKVIARFEEQEGGPHRTADNPPLLLLFEPPAGLKAVPAPAAIAGTWTLARPEGETLCQLELKTEAEEDGTFPLSPSGDCASAVKKLKLHRWQIDGFGLSLLGEDGSSLSLVAVTPDRFDKAKEEGGKPLSMIRK